MEDIFALSATETHVELSYWNFTTLLLLVKQTANGRQLGTVVLLPCLIGMSLTG